MSKLKRWIDRAREAAEARLPEEVVETGKRIGRSVADRAPAQVRDAIGRLVTDEEDASRQGARPPTDHGDDDVVVVVYATDQEAEDARAIRETFARHEIAVRPIDLTHDPKVYRQLATLTDVMVPPWVYIHGKFWGTRYDMESLSASGDLVKIVERRLDELSETALRMGRFHEAFSDAMTEENIVDRLRRGHILCVDDLDCWLEIDKNGTSQLFYEGSPRPAEDLDGLAIEIAKRVAAGEVEASWRFEPEVHV